MRFWGPIFSDKKLVAPGLEPSRGGAVAGVGALPREPCHFRVRHFMPSWCGEFSVFQIVNCPWLVLSDFAYLSYLELNAWHRPDSWYWHRCADLLRCVRCADLLRSALCLGTDTGETCCDCCCLWKTASLLVPTFSATTCDFCLPHDGSRLYAELGAVGHGTNAYSAVVNSEWHKNKVISLTCVRSLCCIWTFHLTLSHYIDSDWVPQNVVTSRHMLYFMPIMSVVSCWC